MLSQEMLSYLKTAIGDRKLEDNEISFLRRKAEELGQDPDEVEMTVKTMLAEKTKTDKIEKYTCPHCGATISSLVGKCEYCGYEFTSRETSQSLKDFADEIIRLETTAQASVKRPKKFWWTIIFFFFLTSAATIPSAVSSLIDIVKIARGERTWYVNVSTDDNDNEKNISIPAKTDEQMKRAVDGYITWEKMTADERKAYAEQRTAEIIENPGYGFRIAVVLVLLTLTFLCLLPFILLPKKTPQDILFEKTLLMYPLPSGYSDVFDLCVLISSRIDKISPLMYFVSFDEKRKVQYNAIWKKKQQQVYEKAKMVYATEPQTLLKVKEMLFK